MKDQLMLILDEDGVAREYDDAYDIVIHCESKEEQDAVWAMLHRRWVPCSERLPKEDEYVLVTAKYRSGCGVNVLKRTKDNRDGEIWEDDNWNQVFSERIIAWMPLPEPYGGED